MTLRFVANINAPQCRHCHKCLIINIAKGGQHPGHPYMRCNDCQFHYTFPKEAVADLNKPPLAAVTPPPLFSPLLGTLPVSAPPSRCANQPCNQKRNSVCMNSMCKRCCASSLVQCAIHKPSRISKVNQQTSTTGQPVDSEWTQAFGALSSVASPVSGFLQQDDLRQTLELQEARIRNEVEERIEAEEEVSYQKSMAFVQDLPYISTARPAASSSTRSASTMKVPVETVPYQPPVITRHMSEDWMRPTADRTREPKKSPIKGKAGLNDSFTIVFWPGSNLEPLLRAVHECPIWPNWSVSDAPDVQADLSLATSEPLQYYDKRNCYWITSTATFPHKVERDGHLFLRRPGATCCDFEVYLEKATTKVAHFRTNMASERAAVRGMISNRKKKLEVITVADVINAGGHIATKRPRTREVDEIELSDDERPYCRQRISTIPSTPPPYTLSDSSCSSSPSIVTTSPKPIPLPTNSPIYIPNAMVSKWPGGMYTMDMKEIFLQVESSAMKGQHSTLKKRINAVIGRPVPENTYIDQRKYWRKASEAQREALVRKGRSPEGLWSNFPKSK